MMALDPTPTSGRLLEGGRRAMALQFPTRRMKFRRNRSRDSMARQSALPSLMTAWSVILATYLCGARTTLSTLGTAISAIIET